MGYTAVTEYAHSLIRSSLYWTDAAMTPRVCSALWAAGSVSVLCHSN